MSVFPLFASRRASAPASRNAGSKSGLPALLTLLTALAMAGAASAAPGVSVSLITPNSGPAGTQVTITGNFDPADLTTKVTFGNQPPVTATVVDATTITAIVPAINNTVPTAKADGPVRVTEGNGANISPINGAVQFDYLVQPTITDFSPKEGHDSDVITITGTGLGGTLASGVSIGGKPAGTVTVVSDTQITVPAGPVTDGPIIVTVRGFAANGTTVANESSPPSQFGFDYHPFITSSTASGANGSVITINGTGFPTTGTATVTLGGKAATNVTLSSRTKVTAIVAGGNDGDVVLAFDGKDGALAASNESATSPTLFDYKTNPTITNVSPTVGSDGTLLTIKGSGFTNLTGITIGGVPAGAVQSLTDTQITVLAGAVKDGPIIVSVTGFASDGVTPSPETVTAPSPFDYVPVITSSTASGVTGSTITINGTGFVPTSGTVAVTVGGTPVTSTLVNSTQINATANGSNGTVVVTFTGKDAQLVTKTETATSPTPFNSLVTTLTDFTPKIGTFGDTVTITGSGFTGATSVVFGAFPGATTSTIPVALQVVNDTTIIVTVPKPTSTQIADGPLRVISPSGTVTSTAGFDYKNAPRVDNFSPPLGTDGQTVVINGAGFLNATGVTFGGTAGAIVGTPTDNQITATVGAGGRSDGAVGVTVPGFGPNGTSPSPETGFSPLGVGFDYIPKITSFLPASGSNGTPITITGTGFTSSVGGYAVTVGGIAATNVVRVSATQITAKVNGGSDGPVIVTFTGKDGIVTATAVEGADKAESATSPTGFDYLPEITAASKSVGRTGDTVTLTGTGLIGTTGVTVGGTAANIVGSPTDTTIVITIGGGATGPFVATINGKNGALANKVETATFGNFDYVGPTTITDFTPKRGKPGTLVTITGTGFFGGTGSGAAVKDVKIGGQLTQFTVISDTQITATVAAKNTVDGPIIVDVIAKDIPVTATSAEEFDYINSTKDATFTVGIPLGSGLEVGLDEGEVDPPASGKTFSVTLNCAQDIYNDPLTPDPQSNPTITAVVSSSGVGVGNPPRERQPLLDNNSNIKLLTFTPGACTDKNTSTQFVDVSDAGADIVQADTPVTLGASALLPPTNYPVTSDSIDVNRKDNHGVLLEGVDVLDPRTSERDVRDGRSTPMKITLANFPLFSDNSPNSPVFVKVEVLKKGSTEPSPEAVLYTDDRTTAAQSQIVTFTPGNFEQTIYVQGVDDTAPDGDVEYDVNVTAIQSLDPEYDKLPQAISERSIPFVNLDDEENPNAQLPGVIIDGGVPPTLNTTEDGVADTFRIRLATRPRSGGTGDTGKVVITLRSNRTDEATPDVSSVTFDETNWDQDQFVRVTGKDDSLQDGPQNFKILTFVDTKDPNVPAASRQTNDPNYGGTPQPAPNQNLAPIGGIDPADVSGINQDNDVAGFAVTPTMLTILEGQTGTFDVRLNKKPSADVFMSLSSADSSLATVSPLQLHFTPANYATLQTVTVTSVDEKIVNPNSATVIKFANSSSQDSSYNTKKPADVPISFIDNDVPGISVTPTSGLVTDENGLTAKFAVTLNTQPSSNVTIQLASSNANEGTPNPTSLTFTPTDYNVASAHTVTVTGKDDPTIDSIDGDQVYSIITSPATGDPAYVNIDAPDVVLTNLDKDTQHVIVTAPSSLKTTEAGGTDKFTVHLSNPPSQNVTLDVSSSDTTEGLVSSGALPTPAASVTLTFTPGNYSVDQTVTVTGQDDFLVDGAVAYSVNLANTSSTDLAFNGLQSSPIPATNTDDDVASYIITPVTTPVPGNTLKTTESGVADTFTVALGAQPSADVTITFTSSKPGEGLVSTVGSPIPAATTTVTFTPANYNTPQTVTVTGVNDATPTSDGDILYNVKGVPVSTDAKFAAAPIPVVNVINKDNDIFVVTPPVGLVTTEAGGTQTINIALSSQPTSNVSVFAVSNDTTEGTVPATALVFTPANFATPQPLVVTGVDDVDVDGDQTYTLTLTSQSTDADFTGLTSAPISLVNKDNDKADTVVTPQTGLITTEGGVPDFFTVSLTARPAQNVTISLTSSDTTEGTVSPSSLTFTPANYNSPQIVTVTGVDDSIIDTDIPYNIITGAMQSADPVFNNVPVPDVKVTNKDDDALQAPTITGFDPDTGATGAAVTITGSNFSPQSTVAFGGTGASSVTFVSKSKLIAIVGGGKTGKVTVVNPGFAAATSGGDFTYIAPVPAPKPTTVTPATASFVGLAPELVEGEPAFDIVTLHMDCAHQNFDNDTSTIKDNAGTVFFELVVTDTAGASGVPPQLQSYSVSFPPGSCGTDQDITIVHGGNDTVQGGRIYTISASTTSTEKGYTGLTASISGNRYDPHQVEVSDPNINRTSENDNVTHRTSTFKVSLNRLSEFPDQAPTSPVFVRLRSTDPTEGLIFTDDQPIANEEQVLRFDATNWKVPQTVFVRGVDDTIDDGDPLYAIRVEDVTSRDTEYQGLTNDQPTNVFAKLTGIGQLAYFTNADNEQNGGQTSDNLPGVLINPTSGLQTSESGTTATFRVRLNSRPRSAADINVGKVVVTFASSRTDEVSVAPASLTFTQANYDQDQLVTVTGKDDTLEDGNQPFRIVTGIDGALTNDVNYQTIDPQDVTGVNADNDGAGFSVNPTDMVIDEGSNDTFSVRLNKAPANDVIIGVHVDDTTIATVSTARLTFTAANFATPQVVTVQTIDNNVTNQPNSVAKVILDPAVSQDSSYSGVDPSDVNVTVIDNDIVGFTETPLTGLTTTEAGGTATFTVKLNKQPTADVTLGYTSDNVNEGTVSPASLTFTSANFDIPQTVTVTGVDDSIVDGNVTYHIVPQAATSADTGYNGLKPSKVTVVNTDNDVIGASVTPSSGLTTTEAGGTAKFSIVLTAKPQKDVTITLTSSDTTEGTVSPASLTFTSTNFNTPKFVTVKGVDDNIDDGDIAYKIITGAMQSQDLTFNGKAVADVSLKNIDNDASTFIVTPLTLRTAEGGPAKTFTVRLSNAPSSGTVQINLVSSDLTEGTISPASLTFNAADFGTAKTVTVTPQNDVERDGSVPYQIKGTVTSTSSPDFRVVPFPAVNVTNDDTDVSSVIVTPTTLSMTEGQSKTFTMALGSKPKQPVTIDLSVSPLGAGTVTPASVTILPAKYASPVTVTVKTTDDQVDAPNNAFTVVTKATVSNDSLYNNIPVPDVRVTSLDNDTFGFDVTPTSGLKTSENGLSATFKVRLKSQPTADVTIPLSVTPSTEASTSSSSLTFTAANWNVYQTVTVTGLDDLIIDGTKAFTVVTGASISNDTFYNNKAVPDVTGTNADNDVAGINVTPVSGLTTKEDGTTATFDVSLKAQPAANVTLKLTSSNTAEGVPTVGSLVFTPTDYSTPQTVTVRGVDDQVDDGNKGYTVAVGPATGDPGYVGKSGPTVTLTNIDDDTKGVIVTPTTGYTTEAGKVHTSTIKLATKPLQTVTVTATVSKPAEGVLNQSVFTFTTATWNTPQTIRVTGHNDGVPDGNQPYVVSLKATSSDPAYNNLVAPSISLTNYESGVIVSRTTGATTEAGGSFTFTVRLTGKPASPVTIRVTSSKTSEGTVTPGSLVFAADDTFSVPQTVTVKGVDDDFVDGTQAYTISFVATSSDPGYANKPIPTIAATNADNDTAGITVTPTSGLVTTESQGTASFTVVLKSAPRSPVTIALSSSDTTEGTVSPSSLSFDKTNFSAPQTVTITGVDDDLIDGPKAYKIITGNSVSSDSDYSNKVIPDVDVTNTDNDSDGGTGDGGGTGGPPTDFAVIGKTYAFSVPFTDSATATSTTTATKAFTVPPTSGATTNFSLQRFNPLTQQLETLSNTSTIKRGEGYLITPVTTGTGIKRPADDPTRIPTAVTSFDVTLHLNPSLDSHDANNGMNLIGFPFDPAQYSLSKWLSSQVKAKDGTIYPTVTAAAAAGVMDSRLFTLDESDNNGGNFIEVTNIGLVPYEGYYARTYQDGVVVTLKVP